jgi:DNA topoisomerase IA
MPNRLIIVESPSKARTLAKFLGAGYTVKASMGHVRDLPKSKIGVDIDAGFVPEYQVIKGKEKQIKELQAASRKADSTLLAADPDREGEAIAWHIAQALKLDNPDRVVFHEITKAAVEAALADPRKIDRGLVSAQEARRVIDRLVGYKLSPLLWRKVRTGLSAGRVQSVAVRLVVDRESEIDAFVTKESWTVDAVLEKGGPSSRHVWSAGAATRRQPTSTSSSSGLRRRRPSWPRPSASTRPAIPLPRHHASRSRASTARRPRGRRRFRTPPAPSSRMPARGCVSRRGAR